MRLICPHVLVVFPVGVSLLWQVSFMAWRFCVVLCCWIAVSQRKRLSIAVSTFLFLLNLSWLQLDEAPKMYLTRSHNTTRCELLKRLNHPIHVQATMCTSCFLQQPTGLHIRIQNKIQFPVIQVTPCFLSIILIKLHKISQFILRRIYWDKIFWKHLSKV